MAVSRDDEDRTEGIHEVMADGVGPEPPVVGGPARVFAEAGRIRTRQRSVAGALSVVAVLGVAGGIFAVNQGGGRGADKVAPAGATTGASGPAEASSSPANTRSASPESAPQVPPSSAAAAATGAGTTVVVTAEGCASVTVKATPAKQGPTVPMDSRSSLELLKQLLPAGFKASHYAGEDSANGVPGTFAGMAIDDGHGQGGIGVNANQAGITGDGTECQTLPDGSRLYLGSLSDDKPTIGSYPSLGEYVRRVWPDGNSVAIQVFNYFPDELESHPDGWEPTTTRPQLPLTDAQLLAMVSDSRWGPTVTAAFAQQAKHDIVPFKAVTG